MHFCGLVAILKLTPNKEIKMFYSVPQDLKDFNLETLDPKWNHSGSWQKGLFMWELRVWGLHRISDSEQADTSPLSGTWFSVLTTEHFKTGLLAL